MKGNPFFIQKRSGKDEKIFKILKFRTMSNKKDKDGNLLSDNERLNIYGTILRRTSLDELPELFNILKGNMSIVGPRPLLPHDVLYMNTEQHKRHIVKPGLTGLAQCNGRNTLDWDTKLAMDLEYINNISFLLDCKIIIKTIYKVIKQDDIDNKEGKDMDLKEWNEIKEGR